MAHEYPVLAPISRGYPKAEGRSLTCYSPVRRSSTPEEAFPLDLHVLSTPPAFVLSQDQTLHQKNGKPNPSKTHNQKGHAHCIKGTPTTTTTQAAMARGKTNALAFKHPVEFSKNKHTPTTPPHQAAAPQGLKQTLPDQLSGASIGPIQPTGPHTHAAPEVRSLEEALQNRPPAPPITWSSAPARSSGPAVPGALHAQGYSVGRREPNRGPTGQQVASRAISWPAQKGT
jgi:hypothetical protein